jgi:hypothetical protein
MIAQRASRGRAPSTGLHRRGRRCVDRRDTAGSSVDDTLLAREVAGMVEASPFGPHPFLRGGHAQTLARWSWPRGFRKRPPDEERLFEVEPGVRLLARCRWQRDRTAGRPRSCSCTAWVGATTPLTCSAPPGWPTARARTWCASTSATAAGRSTSPRRSTTAGCQGTSPPSSASSRTTASHASSSRASPWAATSP